MARNKVVYLKDIDLKTKGIRSKYIINKDDFINKQYNDLYLKDIVVKSNSEVLGVCDCSCGTKNLVTGIHALVSGKTRCCNNCMRTSCSGKIRSKYASDEYIGKVIGYFEIEDFYFGKVDDKSGVIWKLKCLNCGKSLEAFAGQVCNNSSISCGCILSARNNKYSDQQLVGTLFNGTKVLKVLPKDFVSTGEQYWQCECKYCYKPFIAPARHIASGHTNSCGCQSDSLGVVDIQTFLDENSINYSREYKFDDLVSKYGGKLRYDFAFFDETDSLVGLLEYDGEFHHDISHMFGNENKEKSFQDVQDSDKRKNNYASQHNIPLLRIQYSRDTLIILEELKEYLYSLNLLVKGEYIND